MKIVFLSNYFSHHQKPLCDALAQITEFTFIATEPMPQERKALGWDTAEPDYVRRDTMMLERADVVIVGSAPGKLVRQCARRGQLLFRYSERPLRHGLEPLKYLPRLLRWHYRNPPGKPIWLLSAGAYASGDYAKFGLFRGRALKWGYFPEPGAPGEKKPRSMLWVGRFLELKRPDDAIAVAARLRAEGYDFRLDLVGSGPLEQALREQIRRENLQDQVHLLGTMPPQQVRQQMAEAELFLFTSDRQEGWGAVLSEAMSCGCAVVASRDAGATPYLVRHGENGLVYSAGNREELYRQVKRLLDRPEATRRIGQLAYETINTLWNGEVAARRLVALAEQLLEGKTPVLWPNGPCSAAGETI